MMEINLLNRRGTHLKENSQFYDIDESLVSEISLDFKKDFESTYKTEKTKVRSNKKKVFVYCFLTICILGASFYYQFYIKNKHDFDSEKVKNLVQYVIADEILGLVNLEYLDYSLTLEIEVGSEFYENPAKLELKEYLDFLTVSNTYSSEILKSENQYILVIKFSPFLEIINSKPSLEEYNLSDQIININEDSLEVIVTNLLNSSNIYDFKINKIEDDDLYNITFPK